MQSNTTQPNDDDRSLYDYLLPDHWIRKENSYWQFLHDSYVSFVVDRLKHHKATKVVEIGCGDGWNCGQAVNAGLDVTGFDWSRNGIEHAKRLVPDGKFFCADIRDESVLKDFRHRFDAAMFIEVLEHIPPDDCVTALVSIKELLCDNGFLLLTTPSVNTPITNPQHYQHFTRDTLSSIIEKSGYIIEDVAGYGNIKRRRSFYRWSRFIDNRYWLIKPCKRWLLKKYAPVNAGTSVTTCEGFIVSARKK